MNFTEKYKLPRQLEQEGKSDEVLQILEKSCRIWEGAAESIPTFAVTKELQSALFYCQTGDQMVRGMEQIESTLRNEKKGLDNLGNQSSNPRVSRLLIFSNDGSKRFYRQLEFIQKDHGSRILPIVIDCDSATLGKILFGTKATCKSAMVNHKAGVVNILKAL